MGIGQYGVGQTIPRLDQKKMAQKKTNNVDSVKVKKVEGEGEKTNKGNSRKSTSRVRECLKEAPLEPVYTGKMKKSKQSRPKFSTKKRKTKKKISKVKSADQKSPTTTGSRKTPALKQNVRSRKDKSKLPAIVVEKDEFESEVIFQPRVSCLACLSGRKGEGGNDCWSCRLTRLQNIQEEKMKSLK